MFAIARRATLIAAIVATPALAAGPLEVVSKVKVEQKRRAADGSTTLVAADAKRAVPGDRLTFVLAYRNTGTQPIGNVVLDNPVPSAVSYRNVVNGAAAPELSVDGKTWGQLTVLKARGRDGSLRAATPDDITHVRWRIPGTIAPGARGELAFQGVLR